MGRSIWIGILIAALAAVSVGACHMFMEDWGESFDPCSKDGHCKATYECNYSGGSGYCLMPCSFDNPSMCQIELGQEFECFPTERGEYCQILCAAPEDAICRDLIGPEWFCSFEGICSLEGGGGENCGMEPPCEFPFECVPTEDPIGGPIEVCLEPCLDQSGCPGMTTCCDPAGPHPGLYCVPTGLGCGD